MSALSGCPRDKITSFHNHAMTRQIQDENDDQNDQQNGDDDFPAIASRKNIV
jgi:hypothetical protein